MPFGGCQRIMETRTSASYIGWLGRWSLDSRSGYVPSGLVINELVCTKADNEMDYLLMPGGIDLSGLSHSEGGTRWRRLKRLFTEGHLFDVK
jgi:hypothetical protein